MTAKRDRRLRKLYAYERAQGIRRMTPAEPVRQHVQRMLNETGMTVTGFSAAAGLDGETVSALLNGTTSMLQPSTVHRLRSVRGPSNGKVWVRAVGSRRRIVALLALGWPHTELRRRSGVRTDEVAYRRSEWVTASTHQRVVALYDELSMTPGPNHTTRKRAKAAGYAPPLAWDDDTIDDPDARPNLGVKPKRPRGRKPKNGSDNLPLEEVLALLARGETEHDVARKAGVSVKSLRRRLKRYEERGAA